MRFSQKFQKSTTYLIFSVIALFYLKPTITFKPNGKPREYGFGLDSENFKKTLFTVHFFVILFAFFIFKKS